ncbi:MAG: septal ring lytic transglycosylase RlpA family protein [Chromatiaceae bacterium]|jgi:rare lipoprotein A
MSINPIAAGVLAILALSPLSSAARSDHTQVLRGTASYYGAKFQGRRTASGERFNQEALTAAHKTLPFGTKVRVTNLRNGESVEVKINDRGPYIRGRIIDLSKGAAREIGMLHSGTAKVRVKVIASQDDDA